MLPLGGLEITSGMKTCFVWQKCLRLENKQMLFALAFNCMLEIVCFILFVK